MSDCTTEVCDDVAQVLENSRVCFFDCDGVVFDSNGFKITAMLQVLRDHSEEQRASMCRYWRNNGGMSRNAKFRNFFENIANDCRSDEQVMDAVAAAVAEFGRYSLEGYLQVEPVAEALSLARHVGRERAVIVSGAAESELRDVFRRKHIDGLFAEILGSPTGKLDLVKQVLERRNVMPEEALLIGDGAGDFEVCQTLGLYFVYLDCYSEWEGAKAALTDARGVAGVRWAKDWPTLLKIFGVESAPHC
jgi:phosphoglycolate phosphatase-like HAD superfamily hydrolase